MQYDFIRAAALTPPVKPADCAYNIRQMVAAVSEAAGHGCELAVLPELCITGYTCGDLFLQQTLLSEAEAGLLYLAAATKALNLILVAGIPLVVSGRLYNCAAVLCRGEIRGIVPKVCLSTRVPMDEQRIFALPPENGMPETVRVGGQAIPFGTRLLWQHSEKPTFTFGVSVGGAWQSYRPPSIALAMAGAGLIANPCACPETAGSAEYRRQWVRQQSAQLSCGYICAAAGAGESTTDRVFAGHNLIAENGTLLAEAARFGNETIYADIDTGLLAGERLQRNTGESGSPCRILSFTLAETDVPLARPFSQTPFIPAGENARRERCAEILDIQTAGLVQRMRHTGCKNIVLGVSGGLDSTLALWVAARAYDRLEMAREGICAVTMPCFGTSVRTRRNAETLAKAVGATFLEIPIREAVLQHFSDIGQSPDVHDVTYENAQARERTQVLMDLASRQGGFMLGSGDLSELALGFSTYNGDHMSMYNVNGGVPKTLIRPLLQYAAETAAADLRAVLLDIVDTPVSPELLPPDTNGVITQVTEEIVGPYVLHDFFLYYTLRHGFSREKILFLAEHAFAGMFGQMMLSQWLNIFYRRFFANQFKRSCMPDGPKVGSVSLSPRGDWQMPSDASATAWL